MHDSLINLHNPVSDGNGSACTVSGT